MWACIFSILPCHIHESTTGHDETNLILNLGEMLLIVLVVQNKWQQAYIFYAKGLHGQQAKSGVFQMKQQSLVCTEMEEGSQSSRGNEEQPEGHDKEHLKHAHKQYQFKQSYHLILAQVGQLQYAV